jgi:nitric oxide reductase NorQ protein
MGQTQDPKSYLIGNTHASKDKGTFFSESRFVKSIKTENTIIVLDELTRAHPDGWNLLIPVVDYNQRYLRLDESETSVDIHVAKGVSFISTANIGSEYTATRILDRALTDRFAIVEVDILTKDQEFELLKIKYPTVNESTLFSIAAFAHDTRKEINSASPKISSMVSTRMSIETAELCRDGFTLEQAAEAIIYPHYPIEGSERATVKLLLQKNMVQIPTNNNTTVNPLFGDDELARTRS